MPNETPIEIERPPVDVQPIPVPRPPIQELAWWEKMLTRDQLRLICNCRTYVENDPAGMPGHKLAIIITRMADILDGYEPDPEREE